jgi:cytochrome subunit of sulfide dehydrogenase
LEATSIRVHGFAVFASALVTASGIAFAQATAPDSGRAVAATCASCHASLAGRPREEIVARLREFKSGARAGTVMPQFARGYTDEQIVQAAEWFAAQKAPR